MIRNYFAYFRPMKYFLLTLFVLLAFQPLKAQIQDDSLDIKIGQMLLVGFRGYKAPLNSSIVSDIKFRHIGGVILYDFDIPTKTKSPMLSTMTRIFPFAGVNFIAFDRRLSITCLILCSSPETCGKFLCTSTTKSISFDSTVVR